MKNKKKRDSSVIPTYAIGVVWMLWALTGNLHGLGGYLMCALASVGAWALLRMVFPKKGETKQEPSQQARPAAQPIKASDNTTKPSQPQPTAQPKPARAKLGPEMQSVIYQGNQSIARIRRLNDQIPDARMSAQIDLIERLTTQIFDVVRQHPEKLKKIRQFLNYYLPTTIKLMEQYVTLQNQGMRTENIEEGMQRIETMLDKVIVAFQRQLDSLFESDVVDITADIRVMEQMMKSEGLTNEQDFVYEPMKVLEEDQ